MRHSGTAARWLALAAAVLCRASIAAAQQRSVSVERIGAARREIEPGAQGTLTFRVSNRRAVEQTLQSRLELPPSWSLVIPEPPLDLSPHEVELRLLRIALPAAATPGTYPVSYAIAGTDARDSVLVVVPGRRRIEMSVVQSPHFVPAGARYEARFAIRNAGNARATIRFALSESDGFPVRLDSAVVHLEAGAGATVRAEVQSSDKVTHTVSHRVTLTPTIDGDTARIEPVVSVVEVIPRRTQGAQRFRTVPSQLTLRQVDRASTPTVELRGGGAVSADGTTKTEFLFRGPTQTASLSGEQDEYWLSLASRGFGLRLGDQSPSYTRLGESWRPGVGAAAELAFGRVTLGGFDRRDRRSQPGARPDERGGSVDLRLLGQALAGARYLVRSGANAGTVWTTHALLPGFRMATLDGEYGRGTDSAGGGGAYSVALTGGFAHASYALRRLAADSGFPGLTRGNTANEGTAALFPFGSLSLSGSITDWSGTRWPLLATRVDEWRRTTDGRVAWGELAEAGYRRTTGTSLVLAALRGRRTESMRLYLGTPFAVASLRGGIEEGYSEFESGAGGRVPFQRLSVRGSIGRGENLLAASVERFTGMPETSWVPDDHVSMALDAGLRIAPSTRLSAALSVTRYRGDHPRTPMMLDLSVAQNLPFGHRASWRTRAMSYGPGFPAVRPLHQADYVVPLGLPVAMSGESGTVEAQLVDREAARPLAGVLVRLGDQVRLTNADGRVSFTGLSPAVHYLDVERASLGTDRVVVPAGPIGIAVRPGETQRLELAAVRAARVHGAMRRFEARPSPVFGAPAILEDSGPISGAVLQLSKGTDTLRVSVDSWGKFSFGELAPGRWVLSVVVADLPRYHRFEQENVVVEVGPGDTREVALRVIPAAPTVQVIAEAELTLEGPSPTSGRPTTVAVAAVNAPAATAPEQWVPGRRRVVPLSHDAASTTSPPSAAAPTPEWATRRRRVVPAPAEPDFAPSAAPAVRHHYTVTRWDVGLAQVARVMYDDPSLWPKIWLANLDLVPDPDVIHSGQRLRIPDAAPLTAAEQAARDRYVAGRRP